jgi:putative Mn2+ efflux pump MntP
MSSDFLSILLVAFGLSADCFAVALSIGISRGKVSLWQVFRVAAFFGGFQSAMAFMGWLVGSNVIQYIEQYDHWLAFGLLGFIGTKMIWESFHEEKDNKSSLDISRLAVLLVLAVATSIDALAVGLSFAFLEMNIAPVVITIGIVAFVTTGFAFWLGKRVSDIIGKRAEIAGGLILIGIGVRILLEHLLG